MTSSKHTKWLSALVLVLMQALCFTDITAQVDERSGVRTAGLPTGGSGTPPPSFPDNVNVTQDGAPQNETSIAADPNNPQVLVAGTNDYRNGNADAGVAYSSDCGASWQASTLATLNSALGKYGWQGDPAVVAFRDGVFYYAFIDFNDSDDQNRLGVAKSTDGGQTWPQLGVVIDHEGSGSHDFEDKEYIAVDNTGGLYDGYVYISWSRFLAGTFNSPSIMFARSTNSGMSFEAPIQIAARQAGQQGSLPIVGPDGEVYVVWQASATTLKIVKSTNGGASFGTAVTVATIDELSRSGIPGAIFRTNSFPAAAVDHSDGTTRGNIYVAWADESGISGSGPDILMKRSTDGGTSWSTAVRVSDDTNREYQWFPWLSLDPLGDIDVVFYDRRDAPGSDRFHAYRARSRNGGLSFEPNVRLTTTISDASYDGFDGQFIGDYNGIAATFASVHPFWTDIRGDNAEGYTAAVIPGTTTLSLSNQTVTTVKVYRARTSITASTGFVVASGGDVTFRAGTSITLGDGFAAHGLFRTFVDPVCNNAAKPLVASGGDSDNVSAGSSPGALVLASDDVRDPLRVQARWEPGRARLLLHLPRKSWVILDIYDPVGRFVKRLEKLDLPAGTQELEWDGTDAEGQRVASGVYLYKAQIDRENHRGKFLLVR